MFKGPERINARLVGVFDSEILGISHQHVYGHVIDHGGQESRISVGLDLFGDNAPGQHGGDIVSIAVEDG